MALEIMLRYILNVKALVDAPAQRIGQCFDPDLMSPIAGRFE
jgi:hypothetical protein